MDLRIMIDLLVGLVGLCTADKRGFRDRKTLDNIDPTLAESVCPLLQSADRSLNNRAYLRRPNRNEFPE
jgi:hypothetical protein